MFLFLLVLSAEGCCGHFNEGVLTLGYGEGGQTLFSVSGSTVKQGSKLGEVVPMLQLSSSKTALL